MSIPRPTRLSELSLRAVRVELSCPFPLGAPFSSFREVFCHLSSLCLCEEEPFNSPPSEVQLWSSHPSNVRPSWLRAHILRSLCSPLHPRNVSTPDITPSRFVICFAEEQGRHKQKEYVGGSLCFSKGRQKDRSRKLQVRSLRSSEEGTYMSVPRQGQERPGRPHLNYG